MIIFMGVAGSGKSVQGRLLADELALPWLSTGEFLRMLISGSRRKDMLAGKLLDDHEIIALVQKIFGMIDIRKEFILDGFPRTASQAEWLLSQKKHGQLHVTAVINIKASPETVKKRLLERGRQDDTLTAIKARFVEYEQAMLPILEHFKEAGVTILDIEGEDGIDAIHSRILRALKPLLPKS